MDPSIEQAVERGGLADITTTGRKSGQPRRIEIVFHSLDGDHYITGSPGRKRDWLANLGTNPEFTLHLKQGVQADVPATAEVLTDPDDREAALRRILLEKLGQPSREGGSHHRSLGCQCPTDSVCGQLASN